MSFWDDTEHPDTAKVRQLRAVLGDASTNLKLLYMAAGLGQKTGREALAALNDEITKIDVALVDGQEGSQK